ncbi:uncharacterized protein STEHIDRAFT_123411 [Stereum hirsutum FP-91666 SS1]|uniref:uncharacterized protein n=1 Tax=Stereum hirsutum (strain FP-91666) TaxID=721885 RepID=UPI000444997D|nr:uncharacterized protein STEHIDRAFT_123411 [Stereum hirsutum FP-91666 SS1]EIM83821.1 hypothetical protein STEHIDRAFT_123411 [Stereum hirsutum FP-91666 SS1]
MSSSRSLEDTYEAQNDQRLDELHSKIRTLRGVTTDIYDDAERQNLTLDETSNSFTSFTSSLTASASRMTRSFSPGTLTIMRISAYVVGFLIGVWLLRGIFGWWFSGTETPA